MSTRRKFLKQSALASTAFLIPNFLKGFANNGIGLHKTHGKTLVVIQLSGGNDGLNTIVPFRNDDYHRSRPRLALKSNEVLPLTDELGFNVSMQALRGVYDDGLMSIVNNVGYPNPNRSHFRSMEIWHTASSANQYWSTGWLGRYLDARCPNVCEQMHEGIELDSSLSLSMKGDQQKGMAITNIRQLHKMSQNQLFQDIAQHSAHLDTEHDTDPLSYLYKTVGETVSSASYLHKQAKIYRSVIDYPNNKFSKNLKTIAELIIAETNTSVFYISLGGFDTHVNQQNQQARLLKIYADGVAAFMKDLKKNRRLGDVLVMTFSEFGRRVAQNASNGTDHGTANNLFLMGGALKQAGIYNELPNLAQLDNGDLVHSIDFRSIYASILNNWLHINPKQVLQGDFGQLGVI